MSAPDDAVDDPAPCEPLGNVSGNGSSQDEARDAVRAAVLAVGGANAVVFIGACKTIDPATGAVTSWTERALAYECPERGPWL